MQFSLLLFINAEKMVGSLICYPLELQPNQENQFVKHFIQIFQTQLTNTYQFRLLNTIHRLFIKIAIQGWDMIYQTILPIQKTMLKSSLLFCPVAAVKWTFFMCFFRLNTIA